MPLQQFRPEATTEITVEHGGFRFPARVIKGTNPGHEPVLFLGGAYQSMDSLMRIVDAFLPERSVLMADLPGLGGADYLPEEYGPDYYSEAIIALLDRVGRSQVAIVAASYGALFAYRFAQLHPSRVSKMALIGFITQLTPFQEALAANHLGDLDELNAAEIADFVVAHLFCSEHRDLVNRGAGVLRLLQRELKHFDEVDLAKHRANITRLYRLRSLDTRNSPKTPMLLFTGEYDHLTCPRVMRRVAAGFDDAVFTTVHRADHLCHLEQPKVVSQLLWRYLHGVTLEGISGCAPIEYFGGPALMPKSA